MIARLSSQISLGYPLVVQSSKWQEARRLSLSPERSGDYPLQVVLVEETGVLRSIYTFLTPEAAAPATADETGEGFGVALTDGMLRILKCTVVYVS